MSSGRRGSCARGDKPSSIVRPSLVGLPLTTRMTRALGHPATASGLRPPATLRCADGARDPDPAVTRHAGHLGGAVPLPAGHRNALPRHGCDGPHQQRRLPDLLRGRPRRLLPSRDRTLVRGHLGRPGQHHPGARDGRLPVPGLVWRAAPRRLPHDLGRALVVRLRLPHHRRCRLDSRRRPADRRGRDDPGHVRLRIQRPTRIPADLLAQIADYEGGPIPPRP